MATYESHPANGPILFCFAGVCGHEEQNGEILPQQTEKEKNQPRSEQTQMRLVCFLYILYWGEQWAEHSSTTTRLRASFARYIRASARRTKEAVGPGPITPPTLTVR